MTKQFNLSDKFKTLEILNKKEKKLEEVNYYSENRIKEFIRLLKEEQLPRIAQDQRGDINKLIDKLIGDRLKLSLIHISEPTRPY